MSPEEYAAAARRAVANSEHETSVLMDVHNSGNLLLYLFLEEVKRGVRGKEQDHNARWHTTVAKAAQSVKNARSRIYNDKSLLELPDVGPSVLAVVKKYLWNNHPPPEPSEEEVAIARGLKESEKLRKATSQKSKQLTQRPASKAGDSLLMRLLDSHPSKAASIGPGTKRGTGPDAPREKKPYRPAVGTANYAFMVCLLQAEARGQEFLTKSQLMDDAEHSGLSDKPIHGDNNFAQQNPRACFDGWSNFKRLVNNNPPYAMAYSNPKKIKLTEEGRIMARELYLDAVARCKMMEDPNLPIDTQEHAGQVLGSWPADRGTENRMPNLNLPPIQTSTTPSYIHAGKKSTHVTGKGTSTASGSLFPHGTTSLHSFSQGGRGASTWQSLGPSLAGIGTRISHGGVSPASMTTQHQTYSTPRSALPSSSLQKDPARTLGSTPSSSSGSGPKAKHRAAITGKRGQDSGPSSNRKRVLVDGVQRAAHSGGALLGMNEDEPEVICLDESPLPLQPLLPGSMRCATGYDLVARLRHQQEPPSSLGGATPKADGNADGRANAAASERHYGGPVDGRWAADGCSMPFREQGPTLPASQQADSWMMASQVPPPVESQAQASQVLQKEALKEAAFDVIDLIDSEDETCQKEPASELPSQSMSRAASSLAPPRIAGAAPSWDPIRTATAQMGQTLAAGYHGAGGGLEDPASLPSVSANCPNQNLADTRDAPTIEGASSMDAHLRTANGNASTLARAQPGGSGVPRTTSMALSNTSGNPNARAGQWASSQRSARGLQDGESEAAEAGDDSCLTSTWRLPGLGGDWGVEDVNIRIPPLPPGRLFEEEYEIVLVLDTREQFSRSGHASRISSIDHAVSVCQLHGVMCEKRTLGVGDVIWLARSKSNPSVEYVLDYVIERKSVEDLATSIKQKRYDKQKYVLHRSGLRRPMYLSEGDPDRDVSHRAEWASKAIKTALVQCEVIDGFMVLRTESAPCTKRLYAELTRCLKAKYGPLHSNHQSVARAGASPPTFAEFQGACVVAKELTVRDVWGLILTAIDGIGPMVIDAILQLYPTPLSLHRAFQKAMDDAVGIGRDPADAAYAVLRGVPTTPGRTITHRQSSLVFHALFGCLA